MTGFSFTERGPVERGFTEVFRREIVPLLEHHEARRREMRGKALKAMGVSGLAGVGGAGGSYGAGLDDGVIIAPLLGGTGAFIAYTHYRNSWAESLSADIMPVICRFLGGMEYGGAALAPDEFADLDLVPYYSRADVEDSVNGSHEGLGYQLVEVRLKRRTRTRGRTRTRTVFRGLLIRIELLEEVPEIHFARDRGGIGNWLGEAFSEHRDSETRIETPFPEFEKHYETYARDRAGAEDFLTPELTTGLLAVAEVETGRPRHLAAATRGRGFYLALPRKDDFLSLGSLFRPLTLAGDDLHQCIADLDLPRRVIDTLRGV